VTNLLAVSGLVLLAISIWAWRQNRANVPNLPPPWTRVWAWRWVIGGLIGVGSYFLRYPVEGDGEHYTVYGVPFISYAFDQRGEDYAGVLTIPAMLLNFLTCVLLPQIAFWLLARYTSARNLRGRR